MNLNNSISLDGHAGVVILAQYLLSTNSPFWRTFQNVNKIEVQLANVKRGSFGIVSLKYVMILLSKNIIWPF